MQILTKFLFSSVVNQSCPECQLKVVVADQIADWENLSKKQTKPGKINQKLGSEKKDKLPPNF